MKKLVNVLFSVVLLSVAVQGYASGGGKSGGAKKQTWVVAYTAKETAVNHLMMQTFEAEVEKATEGAVDVQLYPGGQMGSDKEMAEGVSAGDIHFSIFMPNIFTSYLAEANIFELFNVYDDLDHAREVIDGEVGEAINSAFRSIDIKSFGYVEIGFRNLMAKKTIESADDLKGLKVRVIDTANQVNYWNAVGATATPIDWNEVYSSLQTGVIDATELPYEFAVSSNIYELQNYMMDTQHIMQWAIFFMNSPFYDNLSSEYQSIVDAAAKKAIEVGRTASDKSAAEKKQFLEDTEGFDFLMISDDFRSYLRERASTVNESIRDDVLKGASGGELLAVFDRIMN